MCVCVCVHKRVYVYVGVFECICPECVSVTNIVTTFLNVFIVVDF